MSEKETGIQKKEHTGRIRRRLVKPVLFLLLLFVLLLAVQYFFQLEITNVTGNTYYTEDEMKEKVITGPFAKNTLFLYLEYKYFKKPEIPFVQKLDVELLDGHEILITVYEKSMAACVEYMSEYLYFDKDGIVVESSQDKLPDVPVIEGITFTKMTLFQKMEVEDSSVFGRILDLSQLVKRYKIGTKKIVFDSQGAVTLYSGKIKIPLGNRKEYDSQIAELSKLLPEAKKNNLEGTLDMEDFEAGQEKVLFIENK